MRININSKYCLTSDKDQIIVNTRGVVKTDEKREGGLKTGEERLTGIAYVGTVQHAYKFLLRLQVRLSDATSFKELAEDVDRIEAELTQSIKF